MVRDTGLNTATTGAVRYQWPILSFEEATILKRMHLAKQKAPVLLRHFVWCSIVDAFQTSAIDAQSDFKLNYLAETFGLSADLI